MSEQQSAREEPLSIGAFPYLHMLTTRWKDVDAYGHVNNVVYYSYFDTAVNAHLISHGVLDPHSSPVIGLVVETRCVYFRSLHFPANVQAGLRIVHMGKSSVRYQIGLFQGEETLAAAQGNFVHVYVDRNTHRPMPVPPAIRAVMEQIRV